MISHNWPPGVVVQEPLAAIARVEECQAALAAAEDFLRSEHARCNIACAHAWVVWHDEHGWPDDKDYRDRMERHR